MKVKEIVECLVLEDEILVSMPTKQPGCCGLKLISTTLLMMSFGVMRLHYNWKTIDAIAIERRGRSHVLNLDQSIP